MRGLFFLQLILTFLLTITCETQQVVSATPDLSGTWDYYADITGNNQSQYGGKFIFLQDQNNNLELLYGLEDNQIMSGNVSGSQVYMVFNIEANNVIEINGIVNGSTINGTYTCTGSNCIPQTTGAVFMEKFSNSTTVPVHDIPVHSSGIIIDGSFSEWTAITEDLSDDSSDSSDQSVTGSNIEFAKVAVNNAKSKIFFLVKVSNGDINGSDVVYAFKLKGAGSDPYSREIYARYDSQWGVFDEDESVYCDFPSFHDDIAVSGQFLEFSADIAYLDLPDKFDLHVRTYPKSGAGGSFDSAKMFGYYRNPLNEGYSGIYCGNNENILIISEINSAIYATLYTDDAFEGFGSVTGNLVNFIIPVDSDSTADCYLTFSSDGSSFAGNYNAFVNGVLVENGTFNGIKGLCPVFGPQGDISMIAPMAHNDISSISAAYSTHSNNPWGFDHNGIDFAISGTRPVLAVASGEVRFIELNYIEDVGYWQVNVNIKYNNRFSVEYAFEPMSTDQADGQNQLNNILSYINVGDVVSQGDVIGDLIFLNTNPHLHLHLNECKGTVCPAGYFEQGHYNAILSKLQSQWPQYSNVDLCYE